jgi:cell division protein DivIC
LADFVALQLPTIFMSAVNIIKVFRNKYVIAMATFIVLMLFVDHNDIFMQLARRRQLDELLMSKKYYEKQIEATKKNLADLQNNSDALERFAREKFLLKKDNEDVFVVVPKAGEKKSDDKQ